MPTAHFHLQRTVKLYRMSMFSGVLLLGEQNDKIVFRGRLEVSDPVILGFMNSNISIVGTCITSDMEASGLYFDIDREGIRPQLTNAPLIPQQRLII